MSVFGIMHLRNYVDYDVEHIDKVDIRLWMSFFTYFILSISLSNLSKFVIDRQNLIFVISKHYERLKVLLTKILVFFFFALIFVLSLSIGAHILNLYARKKISRCFVGKQENFLYEFLLTNSSFDNLQYFILINYFIVCKSKILHYSHNYFSVFIYFYSSFYESDIGKNFR